MITLHMQALDFLKEVRVELGKVVWPTRDQTIRLTFIVIFVTVMVAFFVGGIDYILTAISSLLYK
jgi:preprotein translocase subunit SecE